METFRIKATPALGCCTLAMYGEADMAVAPDIVELGTAGLREDSTSKLIVDLANLTFMDSSAIGALIHLRNLATASNKELVLSHVPPRVHQVLGFAGLSEHFTIEMDRVVI